jgi:hypothetical protein
MSIGDDVPPNDQNLVNAETAPWPVSTDTGIPSGSGYDTPVPGDYRIQSNTPNQEQSGVQEKEVNREVEIEPGEEAIPGVRPRMKIRGTRGNAETLDPGVDVTSATLYIDADSALRLPRQISWQ